MRIRLVYAFKVRLNFGRRTLWLPSFHAAKIGDDSRYKPLNFKASFDKKAFETEFSTLDRLYECNTARFR
jgi:hypothetical protein